MKLFIKKFTLFLLLIVLVKIVTEVSVPYYFPSTYFLAKKKVWSNSDANSIIFGSSRSHRHMNPEELNLNDAGLTFFNFGIPATLNPELYYLIENFIEDLDSGHIKLITLELSMLDTLQNQNLGLLRGHHWNNPEVFSYSLEYIKNSAWPEEIKEKTLDKYYESFQEYMLSLKKIKSLLGGLRSFMGAKIHRMNRHGFYFLEEEVEPMFQARRAYFLKDTSSLALQKMEAIEADEFIKKAFNPSHLERLLQFKKITDKKGIKLLLVIPPKLSAIEYSELMPIKNSVLSDIVIDTHSPHEYPFAYSFQYAFDHGHMNKEGAMLYSKQIGWEIKEKIQ